MDGALQASWPDDRGDPTLHDVAKKRVPKEQEGLFRRGRLLYGDNLQLLRGDANRKGVESDSVDLIYLDPPFNSKRLYNHIFDKHEEDESPAQVNAFLDAWTWGFKAKAAMNGLVGAGAGARVPKRLTQLIEALRDFLGPSNMLAYLVMMAERIVELHRVLKPTGSIYLHCDPTASHYLKLVLDAVFGAEAFKNEIVWDRASAKNDPRRYGRCHDVLLFYAKGEPITWNPQYLAFEEHSIDKNYTAADPDGRRYRLDNLTAARPGGDTSYEWHGARPYKGRYWAFSREKMDRMLADGRIVFRRTGMPVYKRYLDEQPGVPLRDVWSDIRLASASKERLHWPTQKPVALLERIVLASSNEGDLVLDPFCGCGTTIEAAHHLGRRWLGIDVSHIAIGIIEKRLEDELGAHKGVDYMIDGEPRDVPSAVRLAEENKDEFQIWAIDELGAEHLGIGGKMKKGADRGIDGFIRFQDEPGAARSKRVLVSVKAGKTGSGDVRDLRGVIEREGAPVGVFFCMQEPTGPMLKEAAEAGFYRRDFPRIQIISVADFFGGKRPQFPGENLSRRRASQPPPPPELAKEKPSKPGLARSKADERPKRRRRAS